LSYQSKVVNFLMIFAELEFTNEEDNDVKGNYSSKTPLATIMSTGEAGEIEG